MKIDSHVHVTPPDIIANWEKYAEKEPHFSAISHSKVNKFAAAEDVITALNKDGFDKAVIFGFGFRDPGLCRYVNDYVIEKVREFSDKLIGFAVVSPGAAGSSAEIERCYNAGLRGVGELFPVGQGFNLEDKNETDAIARICSRLGIPLMLHANEPVGHDYPGKSDAPLRLLETFVKNYPDLKIIFAHFGGGIFLYETMKEINESFKNVYYDTAAAPFLYDYRIYNAIKALGLCEKILFGSDYPILPLSRYFDALEQSDLTIKEKELILGGNSQKLLMSCNIL
ncbi:MAG: amidohydrolase family protein [Treponema sp.]|nr:amidohydrolase family protein [Treponema sp.]